MAFSIFFRGHTGTGTKKAISKHPSVVNPFGLAQDAKSCFSRTYVCALDTRQTEREIDNFWALAKQASSYVVGEGGRGMFVALLVR